MAARLTSKEELNIIDDKLLVDGIYGVIQHNPDVPARSDANLVDLAPKANFLCLSFRLIGKIENIVGFSALTKLCLDNNRIKDIVNLETLTNLRWLDLSFNRIHKIQGLKALTRLEDLSLYNNKITIIEGLEHCSSLQCLSLGNNRVDSLDQVVRLRQLRSLRMLTLAGNPICREAEYKMTVLAYVDTLRYLDYALVDASEFNTAQEQYHDELLDVQEKESVVAEKISRDKQLSDYLIQLEDAGNVFAHVLFDDMFTEDADLEKLKHLPGIKELVESFRVTFKQLSEEYIRVAMEKHEKKNAESQCFERSIKTIRTAADQESIVIVENFNKLKKDSLHQIYDRPDKSSVIDALQAELETVVDALMGIEVRQVEKFDALVDDFDNRTNELKNGSLEMQQTFFRAVEELEDKFSNSMRAVTTDLMERQAKEELAEDYLDDEAMSLVVDKEACLMTLSGSHDMHIGKILKREDEARATETKKYLENLSFFNTQERARNRDRILQIHDFSKNVKEKFADILSVDEDEGYEDDMIL